MYFLEYAFLAAYVVIAVRSFSFGVYGLKKGNGALFAVVLAQLLLSLPAVIEYLRQAL